MNKLRSYIGAISVLIVIVCAFVYGVINLNDKPVNPTIEDVEIFFNTPVWELAKAVKSQSIGKIEKILASSPEYINYQDPKYGSTLLMWSIGMEKYKSAEALLHLGADPNIPTTDYGETPLFRAAEYSWIDGLNKKDPKFVELLLRYGADPNIPYIGVDEVGMKSVVEPGTSPLMNSVGCGIKKTKALVEAGADLNYKNKYGRTAAVHALMTKEDLSYAQYIILEKRAVISEPYYNRFDKLGTDSEYYPVELLRRWIFDLESEEYQIKMKIIDEFERQGVDYYETPISDRTIELIKTRYPKTWEEYIELY